MTPEEMEYRIKQLEMRILELQQTRHQYLGICVNMSQHPNRDHPHYDEEWQPGIDWNRTVIH